MSGGELEGTLSQEREPRRGAERHPPRGARLSGGSAMSRARALPSGGSGQRSGGSVIKKLHTGYTSLGTTSITSWYSKPGILSCPEAWADPLDIRVCPKPESVSCEYEDESTAQTLVLGRAARGHCSASTWTRLELDTTLPRNQAEGFALLHRRPIV